MSDQPCRCIHPGPLTGHAGHCCLDEAGDTDPLPPCHPDAWRQLRGTPVSEPLPEYCFQNLPIARLDQAIESLRHAQEATRPEDKAVFLKRADESTLYAYHTARTVAHLWREANMQARRLGLLIGQEPAEEAAGPRQDDLFGGVS